MEKIIVCNLKNSPIDPIIYQSELKKINLKKLNLIVCPSIKDIENFEPDSYSLGYQNMPSHINNKVRYVIIGHSYMRKKYKETNKIINSKIKSSIENNLKVILCIGENRIINLLGLTNYYLKKQIDKALNNINIDQIVVAYEPIYSISSKSINSKIISKRTSLIKKYIINKYNINVNVIYGGGVYDQNISSIAELCDGVMIGRACFDPLNLSKILGKFTKS